MENGNHQQNLAVASFDPARTYAGASSLRLSESEMKALAAPFDDLDYEITPQGFMYLPQALSLKRLNDVLGIGHWSLLLINTGSQAMAPNNHGKRVIKIFYDGALIVRDCFVARAAGESSYSEDNGNQSYATALEAAKTDCRQRCCKDLGIATDAWNPSFIRRWQKDHAMKVWVEKDGRKFQLYRRKDLPPFDNEIAAPPMQPTVPVNGQQAQKQELPWLNHGPDYDNALRELLEGRTLNQLRQNWRISKATLEALTEVLAKEWSSRLETVRSLSVLVDSYNENKASIDEYPWLQQMFSERRDLIKSGRVKPVAA